jgi:hypothetical protein
MFTETFEGQVGNSVAHFVFMICTENNCTCNNSRFKAQWLLHIPPLLTFNIVTYPGFARLIIRVLDLKIEFVEPLHSWLQQFTTHYSLIFLLLDTPRELVWLPTELPVIEAYVTTDGQSDGLSWNKAPIWGLRPDLYYYQTVRVSWFWALSLWREDGSVVDNCCWSSPAQSFSGRSPVGLATIV